MLPAAGGDAAAAAAPPAHTDETFGSLAQALSALATEAAETASEGAVRATAGSQPVVAAATNEGAAVGNGAVPDSSAQPEQRLVPKPPLPRRTPGSRATTTARAGAGSGRRSRGKKQPAEVDMDQALQQFASCIDRDIEELNARFIDSVRACIPCYDSSTTRLTTTNASRRTTSRSQRGNSTGKTRG